MSSRMDHLIGLENAYEEVMAYLDGELPEQRARAAALHLEQCEDCRRTAMELKDVARRMSSWKIETESEAKMSPAVEEVLEKHVAKSAKPKKTWTWNWRWAMAGAAATLCVVVIAGIRYRSVIGPDYQLPRVQVTGLMTAPPAALLPQAEPAPASELRNYAQSSQLRDQMEAASGGALALKRGLPALQLRTRGPMIARTAQLVIVSKEFDKARIEIDAALQHHQGYMGQLSVRDAGNGKLLEAILRVPSGQLAATMDELKKLGHVENESQTGEEVTQKYTDLDARLTNARNSEKRLSDILRDRTGKLSDVLAVEEEIQRVRGEIEQMDAQLKSLSNRVDFATLNLTVREDYKAQLNLVPESTSTRFRNAAVNGYHTMLETVIAITLWILSSGPTLLLWMAAMFFPARWAWRRWRTN